MSSAISRTVMWSGSSISFGGWGTAGSGRAGAPSGRRRGGMPCVWSGPRPCPCGCGRAGLAPGAGGRGPRGGSGLPSEDTGRPASGDRLGAPGPLGLAGGRAPGSPGWPADVRQVRRAGQVTVRRVRRVWPGDARRVRRVWPADVHRVRRVWPGDRAPGSPGLAGGRAPGSPGLAGGPCAGFAGSGRGTCAGFAGLAK